ncbi:hypothetical protein Leryth_024161 [Lithospermum erythrorhizon]|nr:hypothetical protein Leryth_024161 [Lithospermum erythrorhizon]
MVEQESSNTPNEDFLNQLKRTKFWDAMDICNWEGFWFEPGLVKSALTFQKTFEAQSDDVVLASTIKTESIQKSNCKIVYIARNPKDTLVSLWHFFNTIFRPDQEPHPLEKAVENFCNGVQQYGPFYEHVLQYYLESRKRPEKILFLKYEDLQRDPRGEVKKLASFLGKNMGEKEVDKVLWRCSLERLKNLEVNKNGSVLHAVPNSSYFRLGVVGDWKNYLTPEMEDRINETTSLKLDGFGLHFDASN